MIRALASACLFCGAALAMEPVDDAVLAETRAGYVSANGLTFDFGAQITSTLDGQVVLQTSLNLTAEGLQRVQTALPGLDRLVANGAQYGLILGDLPESGVIVQASEGATAFIHDTTGGLVNYVVNNASGHDVVQNTRLTIVMPDLQTLQQQISVTKLTNALNTAVGLELQPSGR